MFWYGNANLRTVLNVLPEQVLLYIFSPMALCDLKLILDSLKSVNIISLGKLTYVTWLFKVIENECIVTFTMYFEPNEPTLGNVFMF